MQMKITQTQLRKIIKEELEEAMGTHIPGKEATLDFLRDELGSWQPEALERLKSVLETERFDLTQEVLAIILDRQGRRARISKLPEDDW
jgi:DNA-directed RNA polymerase subunit F